MAQVTDALRKARIAALFRWFRQLGQCGDGIVIADSL
jgi:hypothetical protein